MPAPKTCSNCQHWSPVDPSLDQGVRMFGTCNAIARYETLYDKARGTAGWRTDVLMATLKSMLESEKSALQSPEGGMAYLRTAKDFSCATHEYRVGEKPPANTSLTEQGARSG